MPKFKDPKTGQVIDVDNFLVFFSSLLFGLFFFLYIGETQHALVMVGAAVLIVLVGVFVSPSAILYAYVFPLIYSFIAPKIVKDKWLNKGYIALDDDEKIETVKIDSPKTLEQQQEEIEIWTTYVESGWYAACEKHPKFVVRRIIDRTQREPSISDFISDDLKNKIIEKWNSDK